MKKWNLSEGTPESQKSRRKRCFSLVREATRKNLIFSGNGNVVSPYLLDDGSVNPNEDSRLTFWLSNAYLGSENIADWEIGRKLIESVPSGHSCHFRAVASLILLLREKNRLSPQSVKNCERFLNDCYVDFMGEDFSFHGANDNAPIGAVAILSLGGSYFNAPHLIEFAYSRLCELDEYLANHGYLHECLSPTYASISIPTLAEIVEHCTDDRMKTLALKIEQKIWQELLLHYHPLLHQLSGPYSRAYHEDRDGQLTATNLMIYFALGLDNLEPIMDVILRIDNISGGTIRYIFFDARHRSLRRSHIIPP